MWQENGGSTHVTEIHPRYVVPVRLPSAKNNFKSHWAGDRAREGNSHTRMCTAPQQPIARPVPSLIRKSKHAPAPTSQSREKGGTHVTPTVGM